jgi:hypothetical protein
MRRLTPDELKAISEVRGLCQQWSRGGGARVAAQDRLIELSPRSIEHILAVLNDHERPTRRRLLLLTVFAIWTALSFTIYRLAGLISHTRPPDVGLAIGQAGAISLSLAFGMSIIQRNYTHILTIFNDVRTIPALVHGLSLGKPEITSAIRSSLIRLLPRVQPQDTGMFTEGTLSILCCELSTASSQYAHAIISALGVIGSASVISHIEQSLAQSKGNLRKDPTVLDAAIALLATLREKADAERASGTLLRASDHPDERSDVLLRAASDSTKSESAILLRPTNTQ